MSVNVESLFRTYGPMVSRRALFLLKDPAEAEDLAQEVFLKVLQNQESLHGEYPSSLLWNITTRLCLNRIRDRKRRGLDGPGDALLEQIADLNDDEKIMEARSMLDMLFGKQPESSRVIAVLHFLDGMTLEETAKEVDMSVSGVRKRIRALKSALHLLEEAP